MRVRCGVCNRVLFRTAREPQIHERREIARLRQEAYAKKGWAVAEYARAALAARRWSGPSFIREDNYDTSDWAAGDTLGFHCAGCSIVYLPADLERRFAEARAAGRDIVLTRADRK